MLPKTLLHVLFLFTITGSVYSVADIWENVEQYQKDFTTVLYASVEEGIQDHDNIILKMRQALVGTLEDAEADIQLVVDYMAREVADIRNQQTDETRELYEHCISLYSDEMRRVPEYVRTVITDCVTEFETSTTKDVDASRLEVAGFIYASDNTRRDIEGCRLDSNSEECISRVVIEILLLTLEIPTNIRELTRRTTDLTEYYIQEIPYCAPDRINGADQISQLIIRYIKSCAGITL